MKRLYNWVVDWAYTPFASISLFIFAFVEAIFFPVPVDILLIVLVLGCRQKAFRYALYATIGSISGAIVGYLAGNYIWVNAAGEFTWFANIFFNNIPGFSAILYEKIKVLYAQWNFWIIFTAGFAPVPYKLFTITAGVFDMNLLLFLFASLISRGTRFFLITFLLYRYGPVVKIFIEKYFNVIALGFAMSLLGGLVIAKLVF